MDSIACWIDTFEAKVSRLGSPGGLVLALACGSGLFSPWVHVSGGREWCKDLSSVRQLLEDAWRHFITGARVPADIENTFVRALPTDDEVASEKYAIVAMLAGAGLGDLLLRIAREDVEQAGLVSAACFHVIDTAIDTGGVSQARGDELVRRELRRQKDLVAQAVARPDAATLQRMQKEAMDVDILAGALADAG